MTAPRPPVGGAPLRLDGRIVGAPVRTPWDAPAPTPAASLDDLSDVDGVEDASPDTVLVKDPDGVLRPRAHAPMRGAAIAMTHDAPTEVPHGAQPGDIHLTRTGDGIDVYQLEET